MSTAQADVNEIDPPPKGTGEENEEDEEKPETFEDFMKTDNLHTILQNRWGMFFLWSSLAYSYHFLSIIIGMDKYVHYSRFTGCVGTADFAEASAIFDTPIFVVLLFHIIEWVRQTVLITTILVGVPWLILYKLLGYLNVIVFLLAVFWGIIAGFTADQTCIDGQKGRAAFL
jgi:hypothetical protein